MPRVIAFCGGVCTAIIAATVSRNGTADIDSGSTKAENVLVSKPICRIERTTVMFPIGLNQSEVVTLKMNPVSRGGAFGWSCKGNRSPFTMSCDQRQARMNFPDMKNLSCSLSPMQSLRQSSTSDTTKRARCAPATDRAILESVEVDFVIAAIDAIGLELEFLLEWPLNSPIAAKPAAA